MWLCWIELELCGFRSSSRSSPTLLTSRGSASLSWEGFIHCHMSLLVARIQIEVSWTWCLWDTMYACIDGIRARPSRGGSISFSFPFYNPSLSGLVNCPPCTLVLFKTRALNDIWSEAQLKNNLTNLWRIIWLTGALTLRPANSQSLHTAFHNLLLCYETNMSRHMFLHRSYLPVQSWALWGRPEFSCFLFVTVTH